MSTEFANRRIVTDGLVFSIDAYNTKSYVSGDTTTYDLTSNSNNGTLVNGVTFDNNYWTFDGTNQNIGVNQPSLLNVTSRTISIWFKAVANDVSIYTRGASRGNSTNRDIDIYGNGSLLISMATNTSSGTNFSLTTPYPALNEWHEVTTTWDGTTSTDSAKLYLNGVLVDSGTPLTTTQTERFDHYIGGDGTFIYEGDISLFKFYNKELTSTEVLQNYNALKWRFK